MHADRNFGNVDLIAVDLADVYLIEVKSISNNVDNIRKTRGNARKKINRQLRQSRIFIRMEFRIEPVCIEIYRIEDNDHITDYELASRPRNK